MPKQATLKVNAETANPHAAESFLKASHLARKRRAHQVTAAALSVALMQSAYGKYKEIANSLCAIRIKNMVRQDDSD